MGVCYSAIVGKRGTKERSKDKKIDPKLKKRGSVDFASLIVKFGVGGGRGGGGASSDEHALLKIPGRLFANGATTSNIASLYTQQGKKGTNQDAMIFWENFGSRSDTVFCGVFDGHGPYGHMVARKVRDCLPLLLHTQWEASSNTNQDSFVEGKNVSGRAHSGEYVENDCCAMLEVEGNETLPEMYTPLRQSMLKAFGLMDKELKLHAPLDCFCSGTTAVTLVKQGEDLIIGNVGDSRAVLATREKDNFLTSVQLTVDLKPNLPREAARIQQCRGRVFALQDEPEVARVWLPNSDSPGLAMARAFGDFCLKDFGLISVPDVYYHRITRRDEFIVLATDGVWDVLSNKEAVDIVASAPGRATAARAVVDCATRAWKLKYPTSKNDDCAVVCLFLDHVSAVDDVAQAESGSINNPAEEVKHASVTELNTSNSAKNSSEIVPVSESTEQRHSENNTMGMSKRRSLAQCLWTTEENEEWSALEGFTRVNSLVSLPRLFSVDKGSGRRRK